MIPVFRAGGRLWGLFPAVCTLMILLGSCTRLLGWGVLLWSSEDPPVPSGTVLPVYIRSNIDRVWVAGIPEEFRRPYESIDKFEVPLAQLELAGSRNKARERAAAFADLALSYAETLQDGLPIREDPDNGARRTYRLREGEIIKILDRVEGTPAISTAGTPLPGDWYRVLTEDGSTGYCFSYRLRIFEYTGGSLAAAPVVEREEEDPDLERVLTRTWSPEGYGTMVSAGRIDLEDLSRRWRFSPGIDTGIAHIYLPTLDRTFPYTRIRSAGTRTWRFEGSSLQISLRSDTTLAVQYIEEGGASRTLLFVALLQDVDDLIAQETARRERLYERLYAQGPAYTSANYGVLSFHEGGRFAWIGRELLVPRIIPATALGGGKVSMDLFLDPSLGDRYEGACSLRFDGAGETGTVLRFMYALDTQGFRMEYVPPENMEGVTVRRRASSPTVIYFFRSAASPPAGAAPPASPVPPPAPERETEGRNSADAGDRYGQDSLREPPPIAEPEPGPGPEEFPADELPGLLDQPPGF